MDFLFTTTLTLDERDVIYEVHFDNEKYNFSPEVNAAKSPSFSFKREHDEWHEQETIPAQLRQQAINALENYLLAQH